MTWNARADIATRAVARCCTSRSSWLLASPATRHCAASWQRGITQYARGAGIMNNAQRLCAVSAVMLRSRRLCEQIEQYVCGHYILYIYYLHSIPHIPTHYLDPTHSTGHSLHWDYLLTGLTDIGPPCLILPMPSCHTVQVGCCYIDLPPPYLMIPCTSLRLQPITLNSDYSRTTLLPLQCIGPQLYIDGQYIIPRRWFITYDIIVIHWLQTPYCYGPHYSIHLHCYYIGFEVTTHLYYITWTTLLGPGQLIIYSTDLLHTVDWPTWLPTHTHVPLVVTHLLHYHYVTVDCCWLPPATVTDCRCDTPALRYSSYLPFWIRCYYCIPGRCPVLLPLLRCYVTPHFTTTYRCTVLRYLPLHCTVRPGCWPHTCVTVVDLLHYPLHVPLPVLIGGRPGFPLPVYVRYIPITVYLYITPDWLPHYRCSHIIVAHLLQFTVGHTLDLYIPHTLPDLLIPGPCSYSGDLHVTFYLTITLDGYRYDTLQYVTTLRYIVDTYNCTLPVPLPRG